MRKALAVLLISGKMTPQLPRTSGTLLDKSEAKSFWVIEAHRTKTL